VPRGSGNESELAAPRLISTRPETIASKDTRTLTMTFSDIKMYMASKPRARRSTSGLIHRVARKGAFPELRARGLLLGLRGLISGRAGA
jgi:hypothetical protein